MIRGLNITLTVKRTTEGARDAIGGATGTESTVYTGVKARMANRAGRRTEQMEGVDQNKVVQVIVWPASLYTLYVGDILIPEVGAFKDKRFIVLSVRQDSLLPTSPRAHIEMDAERYDSARSNQ